MFRLLLAAILSIPIIAFSQPRTNSDGEELTIYGTISNIKEPTPFIYAVVVDGKPGGVDSAKVINNNYYFKAKIEAATLISLYSKNPDFPESWKDKNVITLLLEPTNVKISSTDSFSNAIVSGSKANIEYEYLAKMCEPYIKQWRLLYKNYLEVEQLNDKDSITKLKTRMDCTYKKRATVFYNYVRTNPSSLARSYALSQYVDELETDAKDQVITDATEMYNELSHAEKKSYYGTHIKKKLDAYQIKLGMAAPLFEQTDTSGKSVALSSYGGKYVLLDFWASWCGPCRRENPTLVKVYNAYKDKGFTILSVSLDRPGEKDQWINAIHQDQLTWTHVSDLQYWDNKAAKLYKVASVPQNFLIDPSGKIIAKDLRGKELENKLKELL